MSYALETKKRKFDRILGSISNPSPLQPQTTLKPEVNSSTVSIEKLYQEESEKLKKRKLEASNLALSASNSRTSLSTTAYLPLGRQAFLARLETFRSITKWHVPSTEPVNAAEWAKRGWTCAGIDMVSCGSCNEKLVVDVEDDGDISDVEFSKADVDGRDDTRVDADDDSFTIATQLHAELVSKYRDMIVTAHKPSCPWRRRGCDSSIQRVDGLLNSTSAISGLQSRYYSIYNMTKDVPLVTLPTVAGHLSAFDGFGFEDEQPPAINHLKLATSGWEAKGDDIVECRNCFRSLGLWLYRGAEPVVYPLHAVESHLEYCPWRSEEAQNTKISIRKPDQSSNESVEENAPGWLLVYFAIEKETEKRRPALKDQTFEDGQRLNLDAVEPVQSPEQREKKMKELLRRIKETKKVFNVKALLRRTERPAATVGSIKTTGVSQ